MNILYLCADPGIPIRGHKGAAVHVRALTEAFVQAGHQVTIFTPRPGPASHLASVGNGHLMVDQGVDHRYGTIVACPLPDWPAVEQGSATQREQQLQAYAARLTEAALAWLIEHPDAFIYERYSLWSDVGARLREATGRPLVLEVNAPLRQEAAAYRSLHDDGLAAHIEATQFRVADFVAVVSEPLAAYVTAQGASPARVHVLPNGVDPRHFHPAVRGGQVRQRYSLHGRIVVGFAGRLRPWHDGPTLLGAFARLHAANPAYHLLLVGEMTPELIEGIQAAGLTESVTCTGPAPHTAVPEHLAAMDVAVCSHAPAADSMDRMNRIEDGCGCLPHAPSVVNHSYFSPLKLFEYLACGVPTVAAAIGQPGQLIQPGHNGYLYPPGDAAALAAAIQRLVEEPAHAREVAWNGAALVLQQYTWAHNAARILHWVTSHPAHPPIPKRPQEFPKPLGSPFSTPDSPPLPILDPKLRQRLYRATRPDLAAPLLARQLPDLHLTHLEGITLLKYKPGRRCVLAYTLCTQAPPDGECQQLQVIGKVFRDDRGKRLLQLQAQLYAHGFGPDAADGIHVPQPLAYVPEMRMLVQACAPGETLQALARRSTDIGPLVRRCAEALAKLHLSHAFEPAADSMDRMNRMNRIEDGCGCLPHAPSHAFEPAADSMDRMNRMNRIEDGCGCLPHAPSVVKHTQGPQGFRKPLGSVCQLEPYTLADELRGLDDYTARLAAARPEVYPQVAELRAALQRWAEQLPPAAARVPLHRDFYDSQVLCDGPRLYLIDFDLLALGDAALDVANFTAHLAYMGLEEGNPGRLAHEIDDFIATYRTIIVNHTQRPEGFRKLRQDEQDGQDGQVNHTQRPEGFRKPLGSLTDASFLQRVAFYQAATFFRLLNVVAARPAIQHLFAPLLAHTQALANHG